jgi:hypothetical protein
MSVYQVERRPDRLCAPGLLLALAVILGAGAGCTTTSQGASNKPPVVSPSAPEPTSATSITDGVFTSNQASAGEETFQKACTFCHSASEFSGGRFTLRWNGLTAGDIFDVVSTQMPEGNPGSLRPTEYASIVAYFLSLNGYPAGENILPADLSALQNVKINASPQR